MDRENLDQAEIEARNIIKILKDLMPVKWQFVVILYSLENEFVTCLSTIKREVCIKFLEELLTRMKTN